MRRWLVLPLLMLALGASDRPLWVGPNETDKTLGQAVAAARAGDQIFVRAGTYRNDYAEIRVPLTITGVGGFAHLTSSGMIPNNKAIVIVAADASVTNLEFSGAKVDDNNGAGIRWEAGNLSVRNCLFHDNENGILSATIPTVAAVIDNSKLELNGNFSGQSHKAFIRHV